MAENYCNLLKSHVSNNASISSNTLCFVHEKSRPKSQFTIRATEQSAVEKFEHLLEQGIPILVASTAEKVKLPATFYEALKRVVEQTATKIDRLGRCLKHLGKLT